MTTLPDSTVARKRPIASIWLDTPFMHHRDAIYKALKVDRADKATTYACAPFRAVRINDVNYIAGAIGCPPHLNTVNLQSWYESDIDDVILWQPRTNTASILGEAQSSSYATRAPRENEVCVYANPFAFFRAWGARRAERFNLVTSPRWAHGIHEHIYQDMPGIFVQGPLAKINWRALDAQSYRAMAGVDPVALRKAVAGAYPVPRVSV